MNQPRVFEFAKELGLQTLELMDKLREWKIPVKSHMAELDSETLDLIRSKLTEVGAAKKKVATTKKKAAAESSEKATTKKEVERKVSTTKVAKTAAPKAAPKSTSTKATVTKSTGAKTAAPAKVSEADSAPKVIRRKAGAIPSAVEAREKEQKRLAEEAQEEFEQAEREAAAAASTEETLEEPTLVTSAPVDPEQQIVAEPTTLEEEVAPVVAQTQKETRIEEPTPQPVARTTRPGVKKEVIMNQPSSTPRPRGNIVGRMDLSRATGPRPQQGGPSRPGGGYQRGGPGGPGGGGYQRGGPGGSGGGFQRSGPGGGGGNFNRNAAGGAGGSFNRGGAPQSGMRTGFFSVGSEPFPAPDALRERGPKRRGTPGSAGGGRLGTGIPGDEGAVKEEVVENFQAAEYRKREVVFQPKKRANLLTREALKTQITTPKASKRVVEVYQKIKVADLAKQMSIKAGQIISHLMKNGMVVTTNDDLDFDTVSLVAPEFNFEVVNTYKSAEDVIKEEKTKAAESGHAVSRAPIVTVMGHVDHGKTTLLDAIRKADVASGEAGGITQHIGAYRVKLEDGSMITFIDTPGHQAFTAMRARGANVTDIAIIVVAADDGVMPQTVEAISHAKNAKVPIIVAVNKMDRPNANPDRIKQQLTEYELVPEEWGGTTIYCPVSAVKREGIKELLEQIHLVAEIQELKADPEVAATGTVIEARMEKGRGVVATVLIQAGTLRPGHSIVAGTTWGRVRAMLDDKGQSMKEAGPSVPVEITGLADVPLAGDRVDACENEAAARDLAQLRKQDLQKSVSKTPSPKMSLEDLFSKVQTGDTKELTIVLKSDVAGSGEAIKHELEKIATSEVKVKVVHSAVGGITESDVLLASTAKAVVIGFNVRPDGGAASLAGREGVEIKSYSIIYELIDEVKKAMAGLLAPTVVEKVLGRAEVRNIFTVPKIGTIAGCSVQDGKILRSAFARVVREGRVTYDGKIGSLKRFKDDAREVAAGFECGIGIENFNDVKVGDVIEAYEKTSIAREL